jgi:hypothetical protein
MKKPSIGFDANYYAGGVPGKATPDKTQAVDFL